MTERANVRSIEAIEAFRARLILYLDKTRPILEEVQTDVRRTWHWIQNDQRAYWEREVSRRTRQLSEAKQALFSARLASLRDATSFQEAAVHKARQALEEAEDGLRRVRKWSREFGNRTEPLLRQVGSLDAVLSYDLVQAVAWLSEVVRLLDDYSGSPAAQPLTQPSSASESLPASEASNQGEPAPAPQLTEVPLSDAADDGPRQV